ncbi:MAG: hypothetical protein ACOYMA_01780 [Bacteroidia bacterium]
MEKFKLNNSTKQTLKKTTGLDYNQLVDMSAEEIDNYLQKKAHKRFRLQNRIGSYVNRGSVYLFLNKIMNMDKISRKIARI